MYFLRDKTKEESLEAISKLYKQITDVAGETVLLYNAIEDFFFQDIDYQKIKPIIPLWMIEAGRSPESSWDKSLYEKFRSVYKDPISNRIIHWADIQGIISAFQDRVMAVKNYLEVIYKYIPAYCLYEDSEYETCTRILDDTSDIVHAAINSVFVSIYSSFDLLTKVVYECTIYNANDFVEYKRLRCRKNSIGYKKGNFGFEELKAEGLLYSEPVCVRTICSFRDEFIHNGAWDYRCAIYYPCVNGEPVEPFVLMPDVDEEGHLVSSGSRNKFYVNSHKINTVLPVLVKDVMDVLKKTIKALIDLLRGKTVIGNKNNATKEALFKMSQNQLLLLSMINQKTKKE